MDTRKYVIILLIGCMLVSCTKEIIHIITPGEEGKGKTSLRIVFDQTADTRSGWEYDAYFPPATPTEEESEVSNVLLVIFKNIYLDEFWLYKEEESRIKVEGNTITLLDEDGEEDDLDLDTGIHFFYAILNIPEGLYGEIKPKLENGLLSLTKDEFEKQLIEVDFEYLKGEGENGAGFIMTNSSPPGITTIHKDQENIVSIPVGRALAKVSLAYTPVKTGELHGKLTGITYKTVNHPTRMYLMPVVDENKTLLTPHYNSTNLTSDYFISPVKDALNNNSGWFNATIQPLGVNETADFDYCIENNVKKHLKSNSTGLIIKATFHPVTWNNPDGTIGDKSDDGTFWRIAELDKSGNLLTYLQGYYNDTPDLNALKLNGYKILEYKQGTCYYPFWLRTNGEHLVKRNAFHKIAITHVHGAGAPDINEIIYPDVDPDDKATFGSLQIDLVDWDEYCWKETLGEEPEDSDDHPTGIGDIEDWNKSEQEEKLGEGDRGNQFD